MCDNETAEAIVCAIHEVAQEVNALDVKIHEAAIDILRNPEVLQHVAKYLPDDIQADIDELERKSKQLDTLEAAYDVVAKRMGKKKRKRKN